MKLELNINEKNLEKMITEQISTHALNTNHFRYDLKNAIGEAVKKYVYSEKEQIIEKVVDRASKELVRKGLPRLIKKLEEAE